MPLVQLHTRTGSVRTPQSQYTDPDFIELTLAKEQRVVQIEWKRHLESFSRKTVDWTWTVWIESRIQ